MNSANWTFVGNGTTTSVILKHGAESGNLIIFCNMKIMIIDYDVFDKANYPFFIGEEFCEIKVWKRKGKFNYQFDVLDDVDTPLNKKRREHSDRLFNKTVFKALSALGIVALLLILGYGTNYYRSLQAQQVTRGTIVVKDHYFKGEQYNAGYTFPFGNKSMMRHLQLDELADGTVVLENGLPVHNGDEYLVSYFHANPKKNTIKFEQLVAEQEEQIQGRVINKMLFLNRSITPDYCVCLLENTVTVNRINWYSNLYFQEYSPAENPKHNRETFATIMNHPDMIDRKVACHYKYVEQCDDGSENTSNK